jgi:hypothetical protein
MRESFIQGMVGGGMGGGMMGMIAPMVGGMVAPSMAELSGTQATQAAMDTSMLNASIIERQMSEDKMKEMLAQAVSNQGKTGPDQETGAHLPSSQNSMAPYNCQQDNAWPSWTSMIGGYHWDELKHVKLNMWGL